MKPPKLTLDKVTDSTIKYEFVANVASRLLKILFRSDRSIRLIYSNYSNKHFFGDKFVILDYRFRNALWYKIGDSITEKRHFLLEKPEASKKILLTVHGLFRKKMYLLDFSEAGYVDSSTFCIEVKKSDFQDINNPIMG
ncbi:hypothetical protein GGR22_003367 [Flavobacterium gossypii]|uniref:WYL domain-containing protein n=1 Tax=Flavobacterium gossypii TaxID=1646119 RepID=A0ABR6DUN9_9FLAO|nr:hypothetical protein [Flavobacterium gossypii]MBA9075184.1 hypothetical protein [Flavobacterium gossypii]